MVTVKGFIRSYSAAVRKSERAQQSRAKLAVKEFKIQQKELDITNSANAVQQYNTYIDVIKSMHKDSSDVITWNSIKMESKPEMPNYSDSNEMKAKQTLQNYKPSIIDTLLFQKSKKLTSFNLDIVNSKEKDSTLHSIAMENYNTELAEWKELQDIANGIDLKDPNAFKKALEFFNPFAEIKEIGSGLTIDFFNEYIIINLNVKGNSVIPDYTLSQTSTGKLSKKNMPITKFNELYQDYVCSCILRLAREAFAYLPIKSVTINAIGALLNQSNGYIEDQIILSVLIPQSTMEKINFQSIDPSDSMKNFIHHMNFSKNSGFLPVSELSNKNNK